MDAGFYLKHILIFLLSTWEMASLSIYFAGVKCKSTTNTNKRTPTKSQWPRLSCLDINPRERMMRARLHTSPDSRLWVILMLCTDPTKLFKYRLLFTNEMDHTENQRGFWDIGKYHRLKFKSDDKRVKNLEVVSNWVVRRKGFCHFYSYIWFS